MQHFSTVSSNDRDPSTKAQTHHDITTSEFWKLYGTQYDGVITRPPIKLVETIATESMARDNRFCAILVHQKDFGLLAGSYVIQSSSVIYMGFKYAWLIWQRQTPVNFIFSMTKEEIMTHKHSIDSIIENRLIESYRKTQKLHQKHQSNLKYCISVPYTLYESKKLQKQSSEPFIFKESPSCVKGLIAAKDGKELEQQIDKFKDVYTKKEVITKICKMKYRSAQRKLRIAKYIEKYPQISNMTQRQAEKFITEQQKKLCLEKKYSLD